MSKKKEDLKFEYRNVEELIPYARNAKIHKPEQIEKLAASIREFGFMNPIIIDKDGTIAAGHGRLMAARKLKLKKVPTILASHLTDTQRKAFTLADNRIAEVDTGWDMEMLSLELEDLGEIDYDYSDFMDFGDIGMSKLSADNEDSADDFTFTEPPEAIPAENKYDLKIVCSSEEEQQELFLELRERGYKVKGV